MAIPPLVALALALAVVGATVAAIAAGHVRDRLVAAATAALALGALGAAAAVGVDVVLDFGDRTALLLTTWAFAGGALAEAGLLALSRALRQTRDLERVSAEARDRLDAALAAHAERREAELERTLATERAHSSHLLLEEERRLAAERREVVQHQAESARTELTEAVTSAQEGLESRLRGWTLDLERGQRRLEEELASLGQRQRDALASHEARLASDAERVAAVAEEQREALVRLRADLERLAAQVVEEAQAELEAHAAQRRRALHEVSDRLRVRERALREQVERDEAEARARLAAGLAEAERRQLEQLERALDRAATRLAEEAEQRFDMQIRAAREKSAERLSRELDKSMAQFTRQAERDISDRINSVAQETAGRLERKLEELARGAEAQHEVSSERVAHISTRLDRALANAEKRIAAFEAQIELELTAKVAELERSARAAEGP